MAASLDSYRRKRRFDRTAEPRGADVAGAGTGASTHGRYVVQRHRARRLHYDLRFEIGGVLVSFAVPKGPTLDPDVRRMAVRTEDHPLEYFDFEGVIPAGEYGGGDVIVWDQGTWELHRAGNGPADAREALEAGDLHLDLSGTKLRGRFVLVRRDAGGSRGRDQWLLLHKHDQHAVPGWDPEDHPESVISGRTNEQIAADPPARWHSDRPAATAREALGAAEGATEDELSALEAMGKQGTWSIGGRDVRLTNLDKILFPADDDRPAVTKRDLVRYYASIAPVLIPHLRSRPVNVRRHPDGVDGPGFWQKAVPEHAPEWLTRYHHTEADPGETEWYVVVDHVATLAWLANQAAVELHPWTSTVSDVHRPTYVLFDIDPGPATSWDDTMLLVKLHRTALEHLRIHSLPKVSGKRGVQVWVPIAPEYTFDETRAWAEKVSRSIGATVADLVSWEWKVSDRGGLARLDYTQNAINKTLVAPYSPRARAAAPVSVPVTWDELEDPELRPDRWSVFDVPDRVAELGDLMDPASQPHQQLPPL